jgi:hypothetical protein
MHKGRQRKEGQEGRKKCTKEGIKEGEGRDEKGKEGRTGRRDRKEGMHKGRNA